MKKILLVAALFLSGCGPSMMTVPLTPEGSKVLLVSKEMAFGLPGQPFDRCKILGHLYLSSPAHPFYYLPFEQISNDARNETALQGGNVAIFTDSAFESFMHRGDLTLNYHRMASIMLRCSDADIEASGFNHITARPVKGTY